jgi:signal transduction histidine kinase
LVQAAERNPAPRELRFAPGQAGVIDVTYTANSFAAPGKVRFKYRLLGQATNWFEMGARRGAVFPNLPPGSYRFEVTACNSHGVWQPVPAGFSFAIAPHFYQTWVFYVLCGAMVVAAGGLIQRWRLQIQRKIAALEGVAALERERSRIARDLHDELGAGLAQVVLLSDAPSEHVPAQQKPRDVAREMMQKLDGIVWSLNPERAEAGSIVDYLAGFAEKFIAATPMQLHLDLPQNQPTLALAPSQRHDLLLAFKEMLRNAVTHSHGTAITVRIAFPGESMEVAVRDDGVGFDPSSRPPHRNGLSNLGQRAASLGGTFEIRSAPGQGTEAILTFPMKHQPAP